MGDGQEPVQPSSPFFTANGVLYHSGSTVVVDNVVDVVDVVDVDIVAVVFGDFTGNFAVDLVLIFCLTFLVDVDVDDVDSDDVEVVVVIVEVSVDVWASGMAVRNRIAEFIVWYSNIELWASP